MNKRHYEHTLPNIRGSLSNTYYGSHYYEKWTGYFNRNLWDMIAYFRSEKENGQKFCDMVARQVKLYQQKRSQYEVR